MNWIAFVSDGMGNAQRVECGHHWSSIEAAAWVLRQKPWVHTSDILMIVEVDLWRALGDGPLYPDDAVSIDITKRVDDSPPATHIHRR